MTDQLETTRTGTTTAAVVLAVVVWASAFVAIRAVGHSLSPAPLALLRLAVAAAALTVIAVVKGVRIRLSRKSFLLVSAYAVLWLAGYTVALNAGERHVDAGTAALLVNLAPLIVAFAAGRFLGEGFPRPLVIGAVVSLGGTVIIAAGATANGTWPGSCCACWPPPCTPRGS